MNKRLWSRRSLAIAGGGTLAVAAVAAPALGWVGAESPSTPPPISPPAAAQLALIEHGKLLANGTAAQVTATVTCGPGSPISQDLWVDLAQPRHREIAFGFGHLPQPTPTATTPTPTPTATTPTPTPTATTPTPTPTAFVCDGTPHRVDVVVPAEGRPFREGGSVALGRLEVRFAEGFQQRATAAQTVTLRRVS